MNSKFTQLEELHQKYLTEFGLSLSENAKIVKALKIQIKVDKKKPELKLNLIQVSIEERTSKRNHDHSKSIYYLYSMEDKGTELAELVR